VAFAEHGAKVVLHGRDTGALATVQADITNGGGQAMFVTGDVTKLFVTGDVTKFADIEAIRARWSRPTVWSTYWLPAPAAAAAAPARSRTSARRVGGLISTAT
jgi:NAD(P)-dependent dehydrogenase (short-subunit alcohol dehydrogenase family)